jgi:hypothetical protein
MRPTILLVVALALIACGAPPAGGPPATDLSSLTEEWPCGFGFFAGNPAETTALRIYLDGSEVTETEIDLPHPDWSAVLVHGTNVYANWCDDVVTPAEPTPVEHESLTIIGGHLSIVGDVPEPFGGGELTVAATDLMVELGDGTHQELGSIEITNPMFGFMAG